MTPVLMLLMLFALLWAGAEGGPGTTFIQVIDMPKALEIPLAPGKELVVDVLVSTGTKPRDLHVELTILPWVRKVVPSWIRPESCLAKGIATCHGHVCLGTSYDACPKEVSLWALSIFLG